MAKGYDKERGTFTHMTIQRPFQWAEDKHIRILLYLTLVALIINHVLLVM